MLLAEELLLIAFDDEKGRDATGWGVLENGLAGALLLDLSLTGAVAVENGKLVATGDAGASLPREALDAIRASEKPRDAKHWVGRLPRALKPLKERVARGLAERGILREERDRVLGVVPLRRFVEADAGPEAELRGRLTRVLVDGADPDARTALLVSLLVPLDLVKAVVPKDARKDAKRRAKEIADHGIVGTGLDRVVQEMQAVMMMTVVAAATMTSSS